MKSSLSLREKNNVRYRRTITLEVTFLAHIHFLNGKTTHKLSDHNALFVCLVIWTSETNWLVLSTLVWMLCHCRPPKPQIL